MGFKRMLIILFFCFSLLLATISPVSAHTSGAPYTVPFVMGATNIPIGFIKVWNDESNLYVLFEIDLDSYPEYAMSESHLEVSKSPLSWSAPGLWTYKHAYTPYATSDLYTIPLSSIDGGVSTGDKIYLMAHAAICNTKYACVHVGSAYGLSFKGSFNYTIQEKPPERAMLSIVKTGPLEAYPGGTYLYTIVVTNAGDTTVKNVNVTDILPYGVKPAHPEAPGTPTGIYDPGKNMVNWTLGTIGVNGTVVITLEVVLNSSLTPGTKLTNNATAFGENADPVWDTWNTTVIAGPKVSVEKTGPTISYPGDIIVYTITVRNIGNETAYNVNVTDTINLGLVEYVSSTPAGTVSANKITWSLGTLIKGATVPITLTVRVRETVQNGTEIEDNVEIVWKDDTGQSYGPEEEKWVTIVLSNPRLNVVKGGPLNAYPNQIIEYTILVKNLGGSPALNVNVSDRLPAGVKYVSASPAPAQANNQWVNWTIPNIPAGQTVTLTLRINMTIYPATCQNAANNVTVVWKDTLGRIYGPVYDVMVTRICSFPLLTIDKAGDKKGAIGQILSFTINITNVGGSNAINVKVWDDLPYNLTLIDSNPTPTSYDISTGRVIWNFMTITPGETISISLTVNVTDAEYDGIWVFNNVYANWTDTQGTEYGPVTDIHPIQLFVDPYAEISKSGPAEAYAGSIITYTIMLSNPTLTDLSGVTLVDYLPARVSYVSSSPVGAYNSVTHTITWAGLTIPTGETLTFKVTVKIDSDLPEGAIIVNTAVVTWSEDSDTDIVASRILAPPVGGRMIGIFNEGSYGGELYTMAAIITLIAIVALTAITFIILKLNSKMWMVKAAPKRIKH